MTDLRAKVLELAEIATACPDNLQVVCFEQILKHHLDSLLDSVKPRRERVVDTPPGKTKDEKPAVSDPAKNQDDLSDSDLHVKSKHFIKKHAVTIEHLNNLFYKKENDILPLFEDLRTTRLAEGQIRIALLQCLQNALRSGDFQCEVENVRTECIHRKCYDPNNFGGNFTYNAKLFDIEKYSKSVQTLRLSEEGKKQLVTVIQALQ
jgi:hypothetical protein